MSEEEEEYLISKIVSEIKREKALIEIIQILKEENINNFIVAKIIFIALKISGKYKGLHDLQKAVFEYDNARNAKLS
jgi:hypothetical protein